MKIVHPSEWDVLRYDSIGSSDTAAIVGVTPYQDRDAVLWEKVTRRSLPRESKAIKNGKVLESYVLSFLNKKYGWNLKPSLIVHDDYNFIRASPDGMDLSNEIFVEIKCPMSPYNGIPIFYYVQVQHQLMVCGWKMAYFVVYCNNNLDIIEVKRNERSIAVIMESCISFWKEVLYYRNVFSDKISFHGQKAVQ